MVMVRWRGQEGVDGDMVRREFMVMERWREQEGMDGDGEVERAGGSGWRGEGRKRKWRDLEVV